MQNIETSGMGGWLITEILEPKLFLKRVRSKDDIRKGLMGVTCLKRSEGVLFDFRKRGIYTMWMKDTIIPLDMIWLNEKYIIIGIRENVKPLERGSQGIGEKQSTYIVEINEGGVKYFGLELGEKLKFEEIKELGKCEDF